MSALETDPLLPKGPVSSTNNLSDATSEHGDIRSPSMRRNDNFAASEHGSDNRSEFRGSNDQDHNSAEDSSSLQPEEFYELIGMRMPEYQGKTPSNLEAAHGFYTQMCQEKRYIERKYRLYDIMIMFFLVMQILLSAVFIVLGALNINQHITVAVLGAVSSVIAGVLALMRGQGLPNRLRMERDALKTIILEADELYWDVGAGREVTYESVKKIRDAYEGVLENARRNHPDTWNSASLPLAQGLTKVATPAKRGGPSGQTTSYA